MKDVAKRRRFVLRPRSAAAVLLAAGLGGLVFGPRAALATYDDEVSPPAQAQSKANGTVVVVELNNGLKFAPRELRVKVGDTVEWRNVGTYPHTVTANPNLAATRANVALPAGVPPFSSAKVAANQTFRYTFAKAGTYKYVCLPHEKAGMLGTVIVE